MGFWNLTIYWAAIYFETYFNSFFLKKDYPTAGVQYFITAGFMAA
jgi:hypothetical protein